MKVHVLTPPFGLEPIEDGGVYSVSGISLAQSNNYLEIGSGGDLYVKVPSAYAFKDIQYFIEQPESLDKWNIRQPMAAELFESLSDSLSVPAYTTLRRLERLGQAGLYFLVLFMMQYRRLRAQSAVGIPQARFGALRLRRFGLLQRFTPALFQERIPGSTLWDMFDFEADTVLPAWRPSLPKIREPLAALLDSPISAHIDWNIKNFIYQPETEKLFYIDQKPTLFVAEHGNEHNRKGIRQHFLS